MKAEPASNVRAGVTKILIVDDDSRNIFALSAVLKAKGYNCISSPGSIEALKLLEINQDIKIVLLDMMMPEMDGYEMLTKVRGSSRANLPVIAITAQAMVGDKEKCLKAGASDYLSKPVDVDKLTALLNKYIAS